MEPSRPEMELSKKEVRLSRFISLVLRHQPSAAGITLDPHGWADVEALLAGAAQGGHPIDRATLERIVAYNNKKRFSFSPDGTKIRANQGHSVSVDVELREQLPPEFLYHGTGEGALPAILREGIRKMNRQYVHLSADYQTAIQVGRRHGKPVVLVVDAAAMAADGVVFYRSENGVWLCDCVPSQYLLITPREEGK